MVKNVEIDFLARFRYYNLVFGSGLSYKQFFGVWLSWLEHRVWDAGVVGSSPTTPTIHNFEIGTNFFINFKF